MRLALFSIDMGGMVLGLSRVVLGVVVRPMLTLMVSVLTSLVYLASLSRTFVIPLLPSSMLPGYPTVSCVVGL